MAIQTSYDINPDVGYPGDLAQSGVPHHFDSGVINVASSIASGRKPRPGDGLIYSRTNKAFQLPNSAAEASQIVGILTYRKDVVQNKETSDTEFEDGANVEVCVFGSIWVRAGAALEYADRLAWDHDDFNWVVGTDPVAFAPSDPGGPTQAEWTSLIRSLNKVPVVCANRIGVASGNVAIARIAYGRVA